MAVFPWQDIPNGMGEGRALKHLSDVVFKCDLRLMFCETSMQVTVVWEWWALNTLLLRLWPVAETETSGTLPNRPFSATPGSCIPRLPMLQMKPSMISYFYYSAVLDKNSSNNNVLFIVFEEPDTIRLALPSEQHYTEGMTDYLMYSMLNTLHVGCKVILSFCYAILYLYL